jgi:hypothetical protein
MPTILRDLGWTATEAQLYSVPPYVCACVVAIAVALLSDKTRRRGIYLAAFTFLGIAGFSILRWNHDRNARYGAVYLVVIGAFPGGPGFLSWAVNSEFSLLPLPLPLPAPCLLYVHMQAGPTYHTVPSHRHT